MLLLLLCCCCCCCRWSWLSNTRQKSGWSTSRHTYVIMLYAVLDRNTPLLYVRCSIDQVDVYFLFEWHWFCLWEQLGYRISFHKRPCALYKDNAVGNVVAETGRDFGITLRHDRATFQCRWQVRFDAHLNRLQGHRRQPIARSDKFVQRAYSRRALNCAYTFSHRARCTKTTLLETW